MARHSFAQTEMGLQWFKMSFRLPDNSTTNSYNLMPIKEEWSYRRRVTLNKQSHKTQILFFYKYWAARKVDDNATFTIDLLPKQ